MCVDCNATVSSERERDVCVAREILATLQHCFVKKSDVTTLTAPTHQSVTAAFMLGINSFQCSLLLSFPLPQMERRLGATNAHCEAAL